MLLDTIGNGMMWAIDKPLVPGLVRDIVETINTEFREMRAAGQLLGGNAWFRIEDNPAPQIAGGKIVIDYDYTPVPPLENLALRQRITDRYIVENFGKAVAA